MVAELGRASSLLRLNQHSAQVRASIVTRWEAPPAGWIKINIDGSRNIVTGLATCGGAGCDSESRWCFGFAKDIGSCSCREAKLWGIYEGVATAWSLRYPQVLLETDSREAYEIIISSNSHRIGSSILPSIFELMSRAWEVRFAFVRREDNEVANAMSRLVFPESLEYRRWFEPPLAVRDVFLKEANLVAPRNSVEPVRTHFPAQRAYDNPGGC
ncbi:hypothetical protein V6N11_079438 [Hibiscus sabdariffa]|uniref:RNase H type-1 domain-containing protein n=1 Tax=Hibiscus sabdariffa TaxID=183260 RepID=A0ABR2RVD2_9ROSI